MAWNDNCETADDVMRLARESVQRRKQWNTQPPKASPVSVPHDSSRTVAGAPVKSDLQIVLEFAKQVYQINPTGSPISTLYKPTIKEILNETAKQFRVDIIDIVSSRRTKVVVLPRQVAMYLARKLTRRSMPEIGRQFGGRDHTTVLHAYRKICGLIIADADLASVVTILTEKLEKRGAWRWMPD